MPELSIRDAAQHLGVSVDTVRRRIRRGELRTRRDSRGWHLVIVPTAAALGSPRQADAPPRVDDGVPTAVPYAAEIGELRTRVSLLEREREGWAADKLYLQSALEREQVAHGETRRLLMASMTALPAPSATTAPETAGSMPIDVEPTVVSPRRWWTWWRAGSR